jgi:hypothetical protein
MGSEAGGPGSLVSTMRNAPLKLEKQLRPVVPLGRNQVGPIRGNPAILPISGFDRWGAQLDKLSSLALSSFSVQGSYNGL